MNNKPKSHIQSLFYAIIMISLVFSAFGPGTAAPVGALGERGPLLATTGSISGTVYEADGTTPIESANVWIEDYDTGTWVDGTSTDPSGNYTFPTVDPGTYRVTSNKAGYTFEYYDETFSYDAATPVNIIADQVETGIDFTLEPAGTVSGTVYEADGTTPIPFIGVNLDADGFGIGNCTDANGDFTFSHVPLNIQFKARASIPWLGCANEPSSFAREWWSEKTSWDNADTFELTGSTTTITGIDFTLEVGGSISGTVYESDGSTPIENADVWVEEYGSGDWINGDTTDASGNYTLTGLASGNYRVSSEKDGYVKEHYQETMSWDGATQVPVVATQDTSGIDFTLEPGGTISGTVYEEDGTTPIPNMIIHLDGPGIGMGTCSDSNGDFSFNGRVPYDVDFRVRAASTGGNWCDGGSDAYAVEYWEEVTGWNSATIVSVNGGQTIITGITFTLSPGGSISGTVYEADGVTPIANVRIGFENYDTGEWTGGADTDNNGHYTAVSLPPGDYRVTAQKDGYAREYFEETINWDAASRVSVVAGQDTPGIDFNLDPGGSISGTIYQSDGTTPVQNMAVSLDGDDGGAGTCTDPNGKYAFNDVPYNVRFRVRVVPPEENWCVGAPSDYIEMFWQDAYHWDDADLLAVDGSTTDITDIDFVLPQTGVITGTVTDGAVPLEDAVVSVQAVGGWSKYWRTRTGADGTYNLLVPEGDYTVIAKKYGYAWELYDDTRDWTATTTVSVVNGSPQTGIDFALGDITFDASPTTYNGYTSGIAVRLDPQRTQDGVSVDHIENLFVKLTTFDLDSDTVVGDAATNWTVSPDKQIYTFTLRSDIPWVEHDPITSTTTQAMDGAVPRYVSAYDFEYSIKRLCDPRESPSYYRDIMGDLLVGCRAALDEPIPANIPARLSAVGVTATSATTLEIHLNFPAVYFLTVTSMWPLAAVPQWTVEAYGRANWEEAGNIVTSGRYVLNVWKHNSEITLLRNPLLPADMRGSGNIDRISHYQNPDDATGAAGYSYWLNDQVEVSNVPEDQVQNHQASYPSETELISSTAVYYLGFRVTKAPFDNLHLRRAFSAALDRASYVESREQGHGRPMIHFTPPSMIGAPPIDEVGVGYDPLYAQDQLDQYLTLAGYSSCQDLPQIEVLTRESTSGYNTMIQYALDQWEIHLGCSGVFSVEELPWSEYLQRTRAPDDTAPHIYALGWATDYPDANNYLGDVLHCDHDDRTKRPCNSTDTKIEQAREEQNPASRELLYREIEDLFFGENGEFPIAPIYLRDDYMAVHSWLDWKPTSYAGEQWYNWTIGPPVDPTGQISGYVYQSDGSTPIPDMAVSLLADSYEIHACTDGSGLFTFDTLEFDTEFRVSAVPDWRCPGQPEGYVHEFWQDAYIRDAATPIILTESVPTEGSVVFTLDAGETTSAAIGTGGGSVSTSDVNLTLPASAIPEETTFTITDAGVGYQETTNNGDIEAVASVIIGPEGTAFAEPATLTFNWLDDNSDGIVDGTGIFETDLYLSKNGVLIAGPCGTDPRCDLDTNTITVQVTSLSTFVVGPVTPIDDTPPTVSSISLADPSPTSASSVDFSVTFSEEVTGVTADDFSFYTTGSITGYSVTGVSGIGDTYTVTANTGMYNGTLRLDVKSSGTDIKDLADNDLDGGFTSGDSYQVEKTYTLTVKSQGKYDGWVLESGEFTGKGGSKNNRSKVLYVGDDAIDRQYRTILSFGTAGLPDNAVITKVTLKVKKAGVSGTDPMKTHNGLVVDIKMNKFSTRPTLQVQDFQAVANKPKVGKFPRRLYSGWHKSVLYAAAYPYINVKGRTQFRLRFLLDDNDDNGADILKLYSGNAVKAYRPQLIVEYFVP